MAANGQKLVVGSKMHCPRCLRLQSVLAYRPLQMADNFVEELSPVLKCPSCGWLFSPGLSADELQSIIDRWKAELSPAERVASAEPHLGVIA